MDITYNWADGKSLTIGKKTLIMGILNVTPDSFSDGGKWNNVDNALRHMEQMVADGADIIDIGAESSRPGFQPMSADEELQRLAPILETLLDHCPVPVSVDTFKAETAEFACARGAHIINDIWGLQYAQEPGAMAAVAAKYNIPVVVMHNSTCCEYDVDIIDGIRDFYRASIAIAGNAGMKRSNIIFDPGIGFGKLPEANLVVLNRLQELKNIDGMEYPLLLGTSRKSFIGHALGLPVEERMEATGATCVIGIMKGANIVRVHDVKEIARMCAMSDAVLLRPRCTGSTAENSEATVRLTLTARLLL